MLNVICARHVLILQPLNICKSCPSMDLSMHGDVYLNYNTLPIKAKFCGKK